MFSGMPYLAPSYYMPLLHMQQHAFGYNSSVNALHQQQQQDLPQPQQEAGGAAIAPEGNVQDQAARGQRRAASLWLLLKLAFGVYLFSQNGSIERITGRLRIVRRVPRPPQDVPRDPAANAAAATAEQPPTNPCQAATPAQTSPTSAATSESLHTANAASSSVSNKQVDNSKYDGGLQASDEKDRSAKLDPTPALTPEQDARATSSSSSATNSRSSVTSNRDAQNTNTTAAQTPPPPPQQQRGATWRQVEHGILTFIASLIPTPPPENEQLEANAVPVAERVL
ncbi:hypothetical protein BGW39_002575 [Mortierella sp. 14UC]|nr:hypothetical protein BGW39_002575 [Mortierella sp. 14UC]